jgi:hypothetical protein
MIVTAAAAGDEGEDEDEDDAPSINAHAHNIPFISILLNTSFIRGLTSLWRS